MIWGGSTGPSNKLFDTHSRAASATVSIGSGGTAAALNSPLNLFPLKLLRPARVVITCAIGMLEALSGEYMKPGVSEDESSPTWSQKYGPKCIELLQLHFSLSLALQITAGYPWKSVCCRNIDKALGTMALGCCACDCDCYRDQTRKNVTYPSPH